MKAGLSYRPGNKITLSVETWKDIEYPASLRAGLEYKVLDKLPIRTGIATAPFHQYFGLGFAPKNFRIDYALSNTSRNLGLSHSFSVSYLLNR